MRSMFLILMAMLMLCPSAEAQVRAANDDEIRAVLVLFGSGHLGWLRQDFGANPTLRLRKLEEFVPASTGGAIR